MVFSIKASVSIGPAMARLSGLKMGRRNAILRTAATKASRLVAKTAKAKLAGIRKAQKKQGMVRTGLLQKSIGAKVKAFSSGVVVGIVGPRKGFKQQVGVRTKGGTKSKKGDPVYHDPAHIAHLVELGHGGPRPAPAYPFLRPAFEENRDRIKEIYIDEINAGMRKLAAKGIV